MSSHSRLVIISYYFSFLGAIKRIRNTEAITNIVLIDVPYEMLVNSYYLGN